MRETKNASLYMRSIRDVAERNCDPTRIYSKSVFVAGRGARLDSANTCCGHSDVCLAHCTMRCSLQRGTSPLCEDKLLASKILDRGRNRGMTRDFRN